MNGNGKEYAIALFSLMLESDEADKGKASLGQLAPGTYYLFETQPPDGYEPLDAPIKIIVSETKATLYQGTKQVQHVFIQNEAAELKVTNSAGVELPLTGGPGTRIFMVLGSLLTIIAGILLIARWRYSRGF